MTYLITYTNVKTGKKEYDATTSDLLNSEKLSDNEMGAMIDAMFEWCNRHNTDCFPIKTIIVDVEVL